MEALERRALVMLVVVALLFLRAVDVFPSPTWLVAVYIFGLACLTAASVLLVVAIAPAAYVGRWDSERERLMFLAFSLLVADVVVTALILRVQRIRDEHPRLGRITHRLQPSPWPGWPSGVIPEHWVQWPGARQPRRCLRSRGYSRRG